MISLQPSPVTDHLTDDGTELTRLPYPFHVEEDGSIGRQDFWQGEPLRVVGFQDDAARQEIDLWWRDVVADPQRAVGKYAVTQDAKGQMSTNLVAIAQVNVTEVEDA